MDTLFFVRARRGCYTRKVLDVTVRYSPAEAAFYYHAGKALLNALDPTFRVLDVGQSRTRGRKHIIQGSTALCSQALRIKHTGMRLAGWDGIPDCQRCLTIADFFLTTRMLVAGPSAEQPYPQALM